MQFSRRTEIFAKYLSFSSEDNLTILFTGYLTEQKTSLML